MTSFPSHVLTSHQHRLVQKIPGTLCFRPMHRNLHKEDWALKNRWFQIMVLEKTLESPLDCKKIKAVHPKRNQSWIFFFFFFNWDCIYLIIYFLLHFLNFILFLNLKHCISFAKHWKDWCWSWSSNTLATWCKEQTHWKSPWCWERLKAG